MCLSCGFYKGRVVMDLAAKKQARDARMQAKREAIRGEQAATGTPDTPAPTPEK
jgi:hypothetical protein